MPAYTTTITHATGDVFPASDWNTYVRDNFAFLHDRGSDLASAGTITPTNQFHRVTGTTTITAIANPSGSGQGGNRVLLKFASAGCAITASASLVLTNGPFVSTVGGVIEFIWDDAGMWVEIGRVNLDQPGREWDYKTVTANVPVTATTEASPTVVITGNSVTYDGTRIKLEAWLPAFQGGSGSATTVSFGIQRDTTSVVDTPAIAWTGAGANPTSPIWVVGFDTPAAGAHTYRLIAWLNAATSSGNALAGVGGAGATGPAALRITKA